jgi:hypothetical protein
MMMLVVGATVARCSAPLNETVVVIDRWELMGYIIIMSICIGYGFGKAIHWFKNK